MTTIVNHFTGNLARLLRETFDGPPSGGGAYLDRGTGLFSTLSGISAVRASRMPVVGGPTIAAHAGHLLQYIRLVHAFLEGKPPAALDLSSSWNTPIVDDAEWVALQRELRAAGDALLATVEGRADWDDETVGDAMAIAVHTAYHLGAIRHAVRMEDRLAAAAARVHTEDSR